MKRSLFAVAVGFASLLTTSLPGAAFAQAMVGRQIPDRPRVSVDYYKTLPGRQDDWLALYLKWHRPIMQYEIDHGEAISSTVYANASHSLEPSWDFMVINYYPAPNQAKKAELTRGEIIKKLYPDLDAYTAGEKSRWALITGHWDQSIMEVDLKAKHPGVYYPILPNEN